MKANIVVIGAGGHAKVCIDSLRLMNYEIDYCIGNDNCYDDNCLGIKILKGDDHIAKLRNQGYGRVFIAIGDNILREKLTQHVVNLGFELINSIHPNSYISSSVTLGNGVAVMAGAVINSSAVISNSVIVNSGAVIEHDCFIGVAAHVAPNCSLAGGVTIGKRSFIGIGTSIIQKINVGDDSIIGAGSVIIRNVPCNSKAFGVPSKII